jgi:hypothetical protein
VLLVNSSKTIGTVPNSYCLDAAPRGFVEAERIVRAELGGGNHTGIISRTFSKLGLNRPLYDVQKL